MDAGINYVVVIVQGDVWQSGLFGDNWSSNMIHLDLNLDWDDNETIPLARDVSTISDDEYRVLLSNGIILSIRPNNLIRIVARNAIAIAGSAYLTDDMTVMEDGRVIAEQVDGISGKGDGLIIVRGNSAFHISEGREIPIASSLATSIYYIVPTSNGYLYVDIDGRLFQLTQAGNVELKGTHSNHGVEKVLPFGSTERVILDRKGVIHFMGTKSNRALGLNERENSNVLEAPFIAQDIGVFKGIIMALDQSDRLWSISTINSERVGWHPISEVNRYYHPEDPYPVLFV